ncbi:MAG TPA: type II CAAX endopeptidase family protein [Candidatus Obscuribacterales bacterium]
MLKLVQQTVFCPTVRLPIGFPLTGKQLGKAYFIALLYLIGGTIAGLLLVMGIVYGLVSAAQLLVLRPEPWAHKLTSILLGALLPFVNEQTFLAVSTAVTFLSGFAAQLFYLNGVLRKRGTSIARVVALNLDSLRGSSRAGTLWALTWRVMVAIGIWLTAALLLSLILSHPEQPTVELVKKVSGGNLVTLFLIMAVAAPLVEEVIFRGFLFQALRASFSTGRVASWLGGGRFSDVAAVLTSALMFALQHLQFHPVIILILFLMGAFLAEMYRRTGTLWTPIAFHAFNNALTVLVIANRI